MRIATTIAGASLLCATLIAPAQAGLLDGLKDKAGGAAGAAGATSSLGGLGALGMPSIGSGTASNAAGVLQYCVKNNYLSAASAGGVKDKLMGKLGLGSETQAAQDQGYQQGLTGMLQGSNGGSFDMGKVQDNLKEKACDYVLKNASSLL
ncbi:MAG: DUF2501 domain-containing protein [Acidovorax sp.]